LNGTFLNILKDITSEENVREYEPMAQHCTFKAGGAARYFVTPSTADETAKTAEACAENEISFRVIGNGSNILVRESGYGGVIICLKGLSEITVSGDLLTCGAGVMMPKAANAALDNELTGFEFASGIPGTVGGGVYMNAGAYGREIADIFVEAAALIEKGGKYSRTVFNKADMAFDYRKSLASREPDGRIILLEAVFKLERGSYTEIKEHMLDLNRRRAEKQPLDRPSAGSAFKRPEGLFASKLIDDAGLKGMTVGGAQVSPKHAGFIINTGSAKAGDITRLIRKVQEEVFDKFGVALEPEVIII
jgi:UDP-N-acetylmuramate dehydrogenase